VTVLNEVKLPKRRLIVGRQGGPDGKDVSRSVDGHAEISLDRDHLRVLILRAINSRGRAASAGPIDVRVMALIGPPEHAVHSDCGDVLQGHVLPSLALFAEMLDAMGAAWKALRSPGEYGAPEREALAEQLEIVIAKAGGPR